MLLLVENLHSEIFISTAVTGGQSLIHGFCIDEEFESRSRLAHSANLVVLPRIEVNISHPCFHMPSLWLYGYETTVHETHHIANAVQRGHFLFYGALFIVKYFHPVWLIKVISDAVRGVGKSFLQLFIVGLPFGNIFDKSGYFLMVLILPGMSAAPMVVEVPLHLFHLLNGSFFCIFLHAGIQCGVYFQPVCV